MIDLLCQFRRNVRSFYCTDIIITHSGKNCNVIFYKRYVLNYEHTVTEAEKAVLLLHSPSVGIHGIVISHKSGHQHYEGAFRQVEVGDETVYALEPVGGVDENVGISLMLSYLIIECATLSRVRQVVVPTAITLPPFAFVSFMRSAVSFGK